MTDEPEIENLIDDLAAIGSWGDPGTPPALDTLAAAATPDRQWSGRGDSSHWRLIAACAAVVALLAGVAAVVWTRGDGGTDVAGPTGDTTDGAGPVATCADVDRFATRMSYLGITYDYAPSDSVVDLASAVELVVQGEPIDVREEVTDLDSFIVFRFLVSDASTAMAVVGEEIEVSVAFGPSSVPFSEIAEAFTPGISTVLFLYSSPGRPGGWTPALEGFWVACDERDGARSARVPPVRWSHSATLGDLYAEATGEDQDPDPELMLDDQPSVVAVAFGRVWVASSDGQFPATTTIEVFDLATSEPIGSVANVEGEPDIDGEVLWVDATDNYLWLRATSGGPAYEQFDGADNLVYRLDPATLSVEPVAFLRGDGPLAARSDRVVVADHSHLEILREDGSEIANVSIDDVVGVDNATPPGLNGVVAVWLDDNGLWAYHQGRQLAMRLDPETGLAHSSISLADAGAPPAPDDDVWWISGVFDDALTARGLVLSSDPWRVAVPEFPLTDRNVIETIGNTEVFVDRPYARFDTATGDETSLAGPGEVVRVSRNGPDVWAAAWTEVDDGYRLRMILLTAD